MSTIRQIKRALIKGAGIRRASALRECTQKLAVDIDVIKKERKIARCLYATTGRWNTRKSRNLGRLVK